MARTQKNKATAYHLGLLKAKLAKLRREILDPKGENKPTNWSLADVAVSFRFLSIMCATFFFPFTFRFWRWQNWWWFRCHKSWRCSCWSDWFPFCGQIDTLEQIDGNFQWSCRLRIYHIDLYSGHIQIQRLSNSGMVLFVRMTNRFITHPFFFFTPSIHFLIVDVCCCLVFLFHFLHQLNSFWTCPVLLKAPKMARVVVDKSLVLPVLVTWSWSCSMQENLWLTSASSRYISTSLSLMRLWNKYLWLMPVYLIWCSTARVGGFWNSIEQATSQYLIQKER